MKVGLRILGSQAVVFGTDDFGSALFADVGLEGYERLHELARKRRESHGYRSDALPKRMRPFLEALGADPEARLLDGYVVMEVSLPLKDAGLYLYDPSGTQIAGPFPDAEGIVAASARQLA
ncbi:hypothetical protein [Aureimonas sp. ME7]|uniref:hypothetical protein n=1 Tax=Aureimonas sp. ME7 TaxID=2744252 RepID=UPI0015F40635|nr:hypothetical protein [Aureimonas sp. ME7]